jgi:hypothetical protein
MLNQFEPCFKNFQFQYERSLTKRIGLYWDIVLYQRKCSFKSQINDLTSSDPDTKDIFTNAEWDIQLLHLKFDFIWKDMGKDFI